MRENSANQIYASKWLNFMQSQVGYDVFAGETIATVLDNNRTLLEDSITRTEIQQCVDLLRTRRNLRFIKFMSALCTAQGSAIMKNQEIISQYLFESNNYDVGPQLNFLWSCAVNVYFFKQFISKLHF